MHPDEHLDALRRDGAAFAATLDGDLTAEIAACPGWSLEALAVHLGRVHRWATVNASVPSPANGAYPPRPDTFSRAWFEEGLNGLVAALEEAGPEARVWTFAGPNNEARFWFRRQAQETAVHRWDAQRAIGVPESIDTELAIDGVDELLDVFLQGPGREAKGDLGGTVHVHATDSPHGEWIVRTDGGEVLVGHGHEKGDAAVRATASDLLLWMWGRVDLTDDAFEVFGDAAIIGRWREVLGSP